MTSVDDRVLRTGLVGLLGGAAALHVTQPRVFKAMVPEWAPGNAGVYNLASAAVEATAATLLVREPTARAGGALAFATLLAVYPANVTAALGDGTPGIPGWAGSRTAAWLRLPLQAPPLWAAWRLARTGRC